MKTLSTCGPGRPAVPRPAEKGHHIHSNATTLPVRTVKAMHEPELQLGSRRLDEGRVIADDHHHVALGDELLRLEPLKFNDREQVLEEFLNPAVAVPRAHASAVGRSAGPGVRHSTSGSSWANSPLIYATERFINARTTSTLSVRSIFRLLNAADYIRRPGSGGFQWGVRSLRTARTPRAGQSPSSRLQILAGRGSATAKAATLAGENLRDAGRVNGDVLAGGW